MFTKILIFALVGTVLIQSLSAEQPEGQGGGKANAGGDGKHRITGRIRGFLKRLRESVTKTIDEGLDGLDRQVNAVLKAGNATLDAVHVIIDEKLKILESIPKIASDAFDADKKDK